MASASRVIADLPLFPLSSVLFPDAELQLRIFEQRYTSMLSECARDDCGFGVCLMLEGHEAGAPAIPAAVGTLARISDFYTLPDGLLGISVTGTERFQVISSRIRDDGLIRGRVRIWDTEPEQTLPPEYGLLATILERLIGQLGGPWLNADHACFDDASWVGLRLAELLPLPLHERQHLLELTDPEERLADLRDLLPRFQNE